MTLAVHQVEPQTGSKNEVDPLVQVLRSVSVCVIPGGIRVPGSGFRVSGFGFGVPGSGFRVSGFGFQVSGSGFRVPGFGFQVPGSGFRVSGVRFRVSGKLMLSAVLVNPC